MMRRVAALAVSLIVRGSDLVRLRLPRRLNRPAPGRGVVLYYHAVKPHQRTRFAWQMDTLRNCACPFEAGSPESIAEGRPHVAVTFDDGFKSVVENAVPELIARDIPFTMFVPSGCLGERPSWVRDPSHPSWDERVLSAADLSGLASLPLATLGSHSVTHRNLLDLDSDGAEQELVRSMADLRAAAGASIDLFSFPHGGYNAALVAQARRAGYRRVFSIEPFPVAADPEVFVVGRVAADPGDWPVEFRLKIAGAYRWRPLVHRLLQTG